MPQLRSGLWQSNSHNESYGPWFKKTKLIGWWSSSKQLQQELQAAARPEYDIYQFGVYTGGTMRSIAKKVRGFGHLWGFDSFTGLPEETEGQMLEGKHWRQGGFSAADALGTYDEDALLQAITRQINRPNTTLIRGYFNESLSAALAARHRFRPALLVDVDVDLHSSSVHVLSWLLGHGLLVPGVTYVRYDDWRREGQWWGEAIAHKQMTDAYKLRWRRLNLKEYQLLSIDAPPADAAAVEAIKRRALEGPEEARRKRSAVDRARRRRAAGAEQVGRGRGRRPSSPHDRIV